MNSHPSTISSPLSRLAETGTTSTAGGTQDSETPASPTTPPICEAAPDALFAPRPPIAIMGVPFDNVTSAEAIALIEQMIASRRPHYLVTPNVDFLVQASRDLELRKILFEAHLVVCDGTPLVWASRLLGNPLPERVAGADLVPKLISLAAQKGYRLFFLGATPAAVEQAVQRLNQTYPKLRIAGYYSPPFADLLEMDHDQIKQRVLAAEPDLLFVAFGCPKQEKWIAMHYRSLGVPLTAGVGGTIDFLGGKLKRAPVWMRKTGTEWLFRLAQEPRRLFRRYTDDFGMFGWSILPQWWQLKARRAFNLGQKFPANGQNARAKAATTSANAEASEPASVFDSACQWICFPERLDLATARQYQATTANIRETRRHWLLDLNQVKFIDSTGVGLLIQWKKLAQDRGREMVLVSPSSVVQRALSLLRLEQFFLRADDPLRARQLIDARMREQAVRVLSLGKGVISLEWHGDITAETIQKVSPQTRAYLESCPGATHWVIDLSNVRFLDSSGMGLMIRLRKLANQAQVELRFAGLQPAVRNVLHLAHLEEFLLREPQLLTS